jgi:hypothetical protein
VRPAAAWPRVEVSPREAPGAYGARGDAWVAGRRDPLRGRRAVVVVAASAGARGRDGGVGGGRRMQLVDLRWKEGGWIHDDGWMAGRVFKQGHALDESREWSDHR